MVNGHHRSADHRWSINIDHQQLLPIIGDRQPINDHIRNPINADKRSSSHTVDLHQSSILDRRSSTWANGNRNRSIDHSTSANDHRLSIVAEHQSSVADHRSCSLLVDDLPSTYANLPPIIDCRSIVDNRRSPIIDRRS